MQRPEFTARHPLAVLVDVDNTLLDNDAIAADLRAHLTAVVGEVRQRQYWEIYEALRTELGYADYLGAIQRFRASHPRDGQSILVSLFMLHYDFAARLYPGAIDALEAVQRKAPAIILSDGDAVFQPHKIERAGLWKAVDGRVLVYIHKEEVLDDVERRYPADRYVMVDDKLRLLTAIKAVWKDRVTTVFVRQGHYAADPNAIRQYPPADVTIERIAELPEVLERRNPQ